MSGLEQELIQLGRTLNVPEPPDLAPRVVANLGARDPVRRTRHLVIALAALAVAALLAAFAIPDARSALLRFLQIGGDRIELVDELPAVAPDTAELELTLGQRVSLAEARRRSSFTLLELDEEPGGVYLGERDTVWFLYGTPGGVRLLIAQTPKVAPDEPFILKKLASAGTSVEPANVRGEAAYFLSGEPHVVLLVDDHGVGIPESARLARDVLVWEEDGRTVRLEGDLTRAEALELAGSLR